jgi:modulator of FtsH protease HflK
MPWNDKSNPGPWNSPSGDSPPTPEPADKDARGSGATESGKDTETRGPPWRNSPGLDRDAPTGAPRPPKAGAPPPRGPDLDELSRLLKARLTQALGGAPRLRPTPAMAAVAVIALASGWALTGLYRVQPNQQAVVLRFGGYAGRTGPGLNYHLPYPIESVRKISLASINRLDIGGGSDAAAPSEARMLTRDGRLADVDYIVQWRVSDPVAYLFHLADPEAAVRIAAQSAMRQAVGNATLSEVLSSNRGQMQATAAALTQASLDRYGAGVAVVEVQVRDTEPPEAAAAAWRDLASARQDAETAVAEAQAYRTRVSGEARSEAVRAVQAAQGYSDQVQREAAGEAERFALIDAQYRRAPTVTRQRLYIETMEHVLRASNKVVVDTQGHSTIALPPELFRLHATPDVATAAHAAAPTSGATPGAAPLAQGQASGQPQSGPRPDGNNQ